MGMMQQNVQIIPVFQTLSLMFSPLSLWTTWLGESTPIFSPVYCGQSVCSRSGSSSSYYHSVWGATSPLVGFSYPVHTSVNGSFGNASSASLLVCVSCAMWGALIGTTACPVLGSVQQSWFPKPGVSLGRVVSHLLPACRKGLSNNSCMNLAVCWPKVSRRKK